MSLSCNVEGRAPGSGGFAIRGGSSGPEEAPVRADALVAPSPPAAAKPALPAPPSPPRPRPVKVRGTGGGGRLTRIVTEAWWRGDANHLHLIVRVCISIGDKPLGGTGSERMVGFVRCGGAGWEWGAKPVLGEIKHCKGRAETQEAARRQLFGALDEVARGIQSVERPGAPTPWATVAVHPSPVSGGSDPEHP